MPVDLRKTNEASWIQTVQPHTGCEIKCPRRTRLLKTKQPLFSLRISSTIKARAVTFRLEVPDFAHDPEQLDRVYPVERAVSISQAVQKVRLRVSEDQGLWI